MKLRTPIITAAVTIGLLFTVGAAGNAWAADYTVKPGDTLSGIAAQHGTTWPAIFDANRDQISNPDLIFPGQVFAIDSEIGDGPKASAPKPRTDKADAAHTPAKVRPATGHVTSHYGMRTHPITGVYKLHTGTDFAVGDGNAYAAASGTATVRHPAWAGNQVVIDHGGGVQTTYAHLASVNVTTGQQVAAGDVVGRIGALGMATGPHLHFEVIRDGQHIDPLAWLDR